MIELDNKIQIIDTIYKKVVIQITDTIQPDLVKIYERSLADQSEKFNYILIGIGVVVTVVILISTYFNLSATRTIAKNDAEKIFREKSKKLKEEYIKERKKIDKLNILRIRYQESLFKGHAALSTGFLLVIEKNKNNYIKALNHYFSALDFFNRNLGCIKKY